MIGQSIQEGGLSARVFVMLYLRPSPSGGLFWKKKLFVTQCVTKGCKNIFCTQSFFDNVKKDHFWAPIFYSIRRSRKFYGHEEALMPLWSIANFYWNQTSWKQTKSEKDALKSNVKAWYFPHVVFVVFVHKCTLDFYE